MSRAFELYEWIESWYAKDATTFVHSEVVDGLDLSPTEASDRIRAYLRWQQRRDVKATFVVHRKAGTRGRSTIWVVGKGKRDADDLGRQLGSDVRCRVEGAIRPTLRTIARENPRAKATTTALENAIGSIVELLVSAFAVDVLEDSEVG